MELALEAVARAYRTVRETGAADYRQACAEGFAGLSERDKTIAERVIEVYGDGNEERAERIASQLPPAPVFPLPELR